MNYIDGPNRGYLSVVGMAQIDDAAGIAEKRSYWIGRFKAFFPAGPDSDEYQLMIVRPERLELRSFGLGVAAEPTRWSPVMLERDASGAWRQTN
jgi:general stress protein 26